MERDTGRLFNDPNWRRASVWLGGEHFEETLGAISVIGAPVRLGSITPGRCDLAPSAVRTALTKFSCYDLESAADLRLLKALDCGTMELSYATLEEVFAPLSKAVKHSLEEADAVIVIGGDNGVTRAGVHGLGIPLDQCGLLTFDAHLDLRDLTLGLTNGNPVRALLEDGLPGENIVQFGIQGFANAGAYAEFAHDVGISIVTMGQIRSRDFETLVVGALAHLSERVEAIYVDFDIDVLDRIFAPACPGSRPGGLTPWELKHAAFLCGQHPKVRAIDLVEVDPENDIADATVMTTASCLLSFAAGLVTRLRKRL
jgi:formiminoglutamase